MFKALSESLLGNWGSAAMNFVLEHQLIFSLIVVAFGVVMIVLKRRSREKEAEENKTKESNE